MESTAVHGCGSVVEQPEFDGESVRLLALRNEEIDTAGVVVKAAAISSRQIEVNALCAEANLEHALCFVVLDERGAHDLSELAVGAAARGVHLPEAILRGDVALRDEEIVLRWRRRYAERRGYRDEW